MKVFLMMAAAYGGLGVALGAFGAHALRGRLSPAQLSTWSTAVDYQFWHALGLLGIGLLIGRSGNGWLHASGGLMTAGVLLFSGSLYLLALGGPRWLGPITPIGGLLLLSAWACLLIGTARLGG